VRSQHHVPAASPLVTGQGTHHGRELGVSQCWSGWVRKRETLLPLLAFEHWTVQPTVSHYADCYTGHRK